MVFLGEGLLRNCSPVVHRDEYWGWTGERQESGPVAHSRHRIYHYFLIIASARLEVILDVMDPRIWTIMPQFSESAAATIGLPSRQYS